MLLVVLFGMTLFVNGLLAVALYLERRACRELLERVLSPEAVPARPPARVLAGAPRWAQHHDHLIVGGWTPGTHEPMRPVPVPPGARPTAPPPRPSDIGRRP